MNTLLITYELNEEGHNEQIKEKIKGFPKWARLMNNTWMVKTNKKAGEVRSILSNEIDKEGKVFVINLNNNSWGTYLVNKKVTQWIKNNL